MSRRAIPQFVKWIAAILLFGGWTVGCRDRATFNPGSPCDVTSECDAPLVCRLDRCRVECRDSRDCVGGFACLLDPDGLGACQLPADQQCAFSTDCATGLVCRFGQCTNGCETDVDCPTGSSCVPDPTLTVDGGEPVRGCKDVADVECLLNSDCSANLICARDHRCREECRQDRDCRDGLACLSGLVPNVRVCGVAMVDAGVDAGMDAGMDAGVPNPLRTAPFPSLLVGGSQHTCFYDDTLGLRCWGSDVQSQLAGSSTSTPVSIAAADAVGAGAYHTCAHTAADLYCWGQNTSGELGIGSTGGTVGTPTVVQDGAMMGITARAISGGTAHTCAIDASDVVWCWGDNTYGQLAVDPMTTAASNLPLPITGLAGTPLQVVARGDHACVLLSGGSAQCWGRNNRGQLGNGTTAALPTPTPTPQTVVGLSTAVELVAGTEHTCARLSSGAVVCWGDNNYGQVGDGTVGVTPVTSPGSPVSLSTNEAVELAAGSAHTCAVVGAGEQVECWGTNTFGQCGLDPAVMANDPVEIPSVVPGLTAMEELSLGEYHSCARAGVSVVCWGQNALGQVNGTPNTPTYTVTPISVSFP